MKTSIIILVAIMISGCKTQKECHQDCVGNNVNCMLAASTNGQFKHCAMVANACEEGCK
jgi:hypothetical protein